MVRQSQSEFRANYQEVDCRECGTVFNLGAMHYYDNLCRSCKESQD